MSVPGPGGEGGGRTGSPLSGRGATSPAGGRSRCPPVPQQPSSPASPAWGATGRHGGGFPGPEPGCTCPREARGCAAAKGGDGSAGFARSSAAATAQKGATGARPPVPSGSLLPRAAPGPQPGPGGGSSLPGAAGARREPPQHPPGRRRCGCSVGTRSGEPRPKGEGESSPGWSCRSLATLNSFSLFRSWSRAGYFFKSGLRMPTELPRWKKRAPSTSWAPNFSTLLLAGADCCHTRFEVPLAGFKKKKKLICKHLQKKASPQWQYIKFKLSKYMHINCK